MATSLWDTLQLTLSTDEEGEGCVKVMYDRDELVPGCNLMRLRRFHCEAVDCPEVVVISSTDLELEVQVYYEGEEDFGRIFTLHFEKNPEIEIKIGTAERTAWLGLSLECFLDSFDPDDEMDDDGRYDAWA